MGKFRSPFLLSKFRFLLACFGSIIGTTWLPDFEHSKNSVLLPNWEEGSAITTVRTCKKAVMYGAKVSMSLSSSFSILICTFLLFSVSSGPCVLSMNKDDI